MAFPAKPPVLPISYQMNAAKGLIPRFGHAKFYLTAAFIFILTLFGLLKSETYTSVGTIPSYTASFQRGAYGDSLSKHAHNETLGFEKVFYLNLPHRSDRRDGMAMLAALTNIRLIRKEGVNGSTIHEKAKPEGSGSLRPEQLGSWRGHANVWRHIVEEKIQTALILEDDVDWDVKIHDILQDMSIQLRKGHLRRHKPTRYEAAYAPYGLDWDLLYLGTCWNVKGETRPASHIYEDRNAPNSTEMDNNFPQELEYWGAGALKKPRVRVIAPSWYPVCLTGYAVTLEGARNLLYQVGSGGGLTAPTDLEMINRIQSGHLRSLTIVPPLITHWLTGTASDSDTSQLTDDGTLPKGSNNLRFSGRKALHEAVYRGINP
ncbi:LPS glycosyltransferase [Cordyceps javanica]|uniref:LPS glycosyltransferase n=1 Tax=Cordyceps javanica TaxID=43265 RepID=A0A545V313_9HYPO|nr:LPS glycosyltransferase [Cordyceps javanica]